MATRFSNRLTELMKSIDDLTDFNALVIGSTLHNKQ